MPSDRKRWFDRFIQDNVPAALQLLREMVGINSFTPKALLNALAICELIERWK